MICNDEHPGRIVHSNSIGSPIDSQQFFGRRASPGTVRNLSRHVFLLLSTGSLDHETMLISSMREMHCQSYSHSEFLQIAPISIFCVILNKL